MAVKFNQYWRIISERRKEYGKFIIKNFIPGMNSLGLHVVAGWSVLIGGYSEMFVESMSSDLDLIERGLKDPKFRQLHDNLLNYVANYKTKILVPTGRQGSYTTDYKDNTIKFNQTWDIIGKTKDAYDDYVINEYYPLMQESGIVVAGEWLVLIGDGPHIICEGRVHDIEQLIGTLSSKKFRTARRKLKGLVDNFESRLFSFHVQKVKGYKSSSYHMMEV